LNLIKKKSYLSLDNGIENDELDYDDADDIVRKLAFMGTMNKSVLKIIMKCEESVKHFFEFLKVPSTLIVLQLDVVDETEYSTVDSVYIKVKLYDFKGRENLLVYEHFWDDTEHNNTFSWICKGKNTILVDKMNGYDENILTQFQESIIGTESLHILDKKTFLIWILSLFGDMYVHIHHIKYILNPLSILTDFV